MGVLASNQVSKTNFSANGQTLELDVANLNVVRFEFSGTYAFTAAFEALGVDGVTWFPLQVVQVDSPTVATTHSTANATRAYEASSNTVSKVRVRLTAFTSAGTHAVSISGSDVAIEPAPSVQVAGSINTTSSPATGTAYSLTTAASTNGALIITGAKRLAELTVSNPTATAAYVKLYNKATAPTVGTDVPVMTIAIPATAAGVGEKSFNFGALGKQFPLGIGIAVTAAAAATDTAVTVAGIQIHGTYL